MKIHLSPSAQGDGRELAMRIGFLSLPLHGHLNPMTALARKLQARGNDVVFIGVPEIEPMVRAAGLAFVSFCEKEYPLGTVEAKWAQVSRLHGLDVVKYTLENLSPGLLSAALEHLPQTIADNGIDALVLDTVFFFIEVVAINLGIPYVHVWNVLNLDLTGSTPACLLPWPHEATPEALARNAEGAQQLARYLAPLAQLGMAYAEKNELEIDWNNPAATTSKFAIVSQIPREFDFPGIPWPSQFHYTGPFHDGQGRRRVGFPWAELNEKPLIYASLGTLVNGLESVYQTILDAVGPMNDVQLVLSVGKNVNLDELGPVPENAILVTSAPQMEILKRAALCITHAGLNTTLESLAQGVPMVAIPIAYDQPGTASRIAHHGAGEVVQFEDLTVERLSETVQQVLTDPAYREKAQYFKRVIAKARGLDVAAEVVERAFGKNQVADSAGEYFEVSIASD